MSRAWSLQSDKTPTILDSTPFEISDPGQFNLSWPMGIIMGIKDVSKYFIRMHSCNTYLPIASVKNCGNAHPTKSDEPLPTVAVFTTVSHSTARYVWCNLILMMKAPKLVNDFVFDDELERSQGLCVRKLLSRCCFERE